MPKSTTEPAIEPATETAPLWARNRVHCEVMCAQQRVRIDDLVAQLAGYKGGGDMEQRLRGLVAKERLELQRMEHRLGEAVRFERLGEPARAAEAAAEEA